MLRQVPIPTYTSPTYTVAYTGSTNTYRYTNRAYISNITG